MNDNQLQISVAPVVFVISLSVNAVFFVLAISWPQIARRWRLLDEKMINYGFPKGLNKKLRIISVMTLIGITCKQVIYLALFKVILYIYFFSGTFTVRFM